MKKLFIVSGLLSLFFASATVFAEDAGVASLDEQSMAGTNLSSNNAQNPFASTPMDSGASAQPQPDTAGQIADDSDSW